jgi:hypothetical protein
MLDLLTFRSDYTFEQYPAPRSNIPNLTLQSYLKSKLVERYYHTINFVNGAHHDRTF